MLGLFAANPLFQPSPSDPLSQPSPSEARAGVAVREEEPEGLGDWEAEMKAMLSGSDLFVSSGADAQPTFAASSSQDPSPPRRIEIAGRVDAPTVPHFPPSEVPHFMARALQVKAPVQAVRAAVGEGAAVGFSAGVKWEKGVTLEELRALQVRRFCRTTASSVSVYFVSPIW